MGYVVTAYSMVVGTVGIALLSPAFLPMNPVLSGKKGSWEICGGRCTHFAGARHTEHKVGWKSDPHGVGGGVGSILNYEMWQRKGQNVDLRHSRIYELFFPCTITPQPLNHCFHTSHSAQS